MKSEVVLKEQSVWFEAIKEFVESGHEFNAFERNGQFVIEFTGGF